MIDNNFELAPRSYWIDSTDTTSYPKLNEDIEVDVAIVGGGIVGITCAYLLCLKGVKAAVIESKRIIEGTTGYTTAKVTSQHSLIYDHLITKMGSERAKQYAESNQNAIELINKLSTENNIDCDFIRQPAYIYAQTDQYTKNIHDEYESAQKLGINSSLAEKLPLPIDIKVGLVFQNQAQFHPRKFLLSLAKLLVDKGSLIFENTTALDIEKGSKCTVLTDTKNKVTAKDVVVASHYPFYDGLGMYFARIYPERDYAIGIQINEKFPDGMFINAESPTRSLRFQPYENGQLVIVVGDEHKTGQGGDTLLHYEKLINYANDIFDVKEMLYRWSTQDYVTMDKVPYVGHITNDNPNIYVATGFGKWGMTNGVASAGIIRDMIITGSSPYQDVYSPSRFTPNASAKKFVIENANVAKQLITGKIKNLPDDIDIKNGHGKALEIDGHKVGAYRDAEGKLFIVDTTCSHLGCELKWNSAEASWDCPCHGSRFNYKGEILNGPALKKLDVLNEDI